MKRCYEVQMRAGKLIHLSVHPSIHPSRKYLLIAYFVLGLGIQPTWSADFGPVGGLVWEDLGS